MCGRYTLAASSDELVEAFDVPVPTFDLTPRYNVAPSQPAPVVATDRRGRRIGLLTWGFTPPGAVGPGAGIINARVETVMRKASFRESFERRRCLVPADGFYEWKREGGAKVPYWIHPTAGGLLSFAGIWTTWTQPGAGPRHTFAILTGPASDDLADIHDRMPVIVAASDRDRWLDTSGAPAALADMLRGAPSGGLEAYEVSRRVNRPVEDDAGLIEPVG
jgi:putative SOS response-associated peptidase YedK